jgi:hypothetical protein
MKRILLPALLVLALSLSACSLYISAPITTITPGPTVTDQISISLPSGSQTVDLSLGFGAGTLKLHPGADGLVSGTATYNIADFKPLVTSSGSTARIEQGNWKVNGFPNLSDIKNEWDLSLGSVPMNLTIEAGAYHAEIELGGLALNNLTVKDGAADSKLNFASANTVEMKLLRYDTGASNVALTGLGNANFASLEFNSGAGNYTLDFTGGLKRDGSVHVTSGVSNLTLVIPQGLPVQLTVDGLANVSTDSGWSKQDKVYTQSGSGPALTITVTMGAGNVTITH